MKNKILVLLLSTVALSSMIQAHFGDDSRGFGAWLVSTAEVPLDTTAAVFHEGPYVYPDDYRKPRRDQNYSRRSNREIQKDIDQIRKQARRERRDLRADERADIARLERQMRR